MQTYKYRFPASGRDHELLSLEMLEDRLKYSHDCLMTYCMFPADSEILDHISYDFDKENNLTALNLHTYTKLWEGREADLKYCMETNLSKIADRIWKDPSKGVNITGNVEYLGLEGKVPKILYHIAEREKVDDILKKGLIPEAGTNDYKSERNYVYMCDENNLAPWLAILPNMKDPVIIEIHTVEIKDIEPGRMFKDRSYIKDGYSEYRASSIIPASNIKETEINEWNHLGIRVSAAVINQIKSAVDKEELRETSGGIRRIEKMGLISKQYADNIIKQTAELMNKDNESFKIGDKVWWYDKQQNLQSGRIFNFKNNCALIKQGKNGEIRAEARLSDCWHTKDACIEAEIRKAETQDDEDFKQAIESIEFSDNAKLNV